MRGVSSSRTARPALVLAALLSAAPLLEGCGAGGLADGPREQVCGQWIGRAEQTVGSGPWYVDASTGAEVEIRAAAGSSGTWIRLTDTCAHGAQVTTSDDRIAALGPIVRAEDGRAAAILVHPEAVGRATVTVHDREETAVTVVVTSPPSLPSSTP